MAAPIKMDELLVSWLGSDDVYENLLKLIEKYDEEGKAAAANGGSNGGGEHGESSSYSSSTNKNNKSHPGSTLDAATARRQRQPIPPFYPLKTWNGIALQRRRKLPRQFETWDPLPPETTQTEDSKSNGGGAGDGAGAGANSGNGGATTKAGRKNASGSKAQRPGGSDAAAAAAAEQSGAEPSSSSSSSSSSVDPANNICVRDQIQKLLTELQILPPESNANSNANNKNVSIGLEVFVRITKEICHFPSFFNGPLYQRILTLWNQQQHPNQPTQSHVTLELLEWYWKREMEPFDAHDRFFRLVKQPHEDCILRDDFLPYIKALLNDHPGLEFLSNHAEFQEKYAVTVITRIFYSVNKCHSGRITSRQVKRSDILDAFSQVDEEEDINKVTRYFSYEHFYVLYCRFWELDHDRDYRITRQDLLKYGDCSLSHMIVDRIFDSAPRPFEGDNNVDREHLSYEEFIYFMLSEEDKSNEVSVRYWFNCVDVDGDGKLNNMEMRSFYAVQLHRMQCMGHEIVPFEDMLCQMMDMIKPKHPEHLIVEDFLQPECAQVSGALFDALFNLNKYLLFEQRDPFVERQKREDEFETDWDRFACIDYNRLAMEEEAREEEAMEIDWVTVDEDDDEEPGEFNGVVTSEAPF